MSIKPAKQIPMSDVVKIEPPEEQTYPNETSDQPISLNQNKREIKLKKALLNEQELNAKYSNEIAILILKIEAQKNIEKRLCKTIDAYKAEIDILRRNCNSCQCLTEKSITNANKNGIFEALIYVN